MSLIVFAFVFVFLYLYRPRLKIPVDSVEANTEPTFGIISSVFGKVFFGIVYIDVSIYIGI